MVEKHVGNQETFGGFLARPKLSEVKDSIFQKTLFNLAVASSRGFFT
jgi:hypothetical protein